jgi:hypothetical protein
MMQIHNEFIFDRDFRPRILTITSESTGLRSTVKVALEHNDQQALGFSEGSIASASTPPSCCTSNT